MHEWDTWYAKTAQDEDEGEPEDEADLDDES